MVQMEQNREGLESCIEVIKDLNAPAPKRHKCYKNLMRIWKETKDVAAGAYVHYYKAFHFVETGKNMKVFRAAMSAISFAEQCGNDFWIKKKAYNLLGISAAKQGSLLTALNYYLKELDVLKEEKSSDCTTYHIVKANIGCLYAELGEYKKAIPYFLSAKNYIKKEKEGKSIVAESAIYMNLAESYYKTGQIKALRSCVKHMEELRDDNPKWLKHCFIYDIFDYVLTLIEGCEEKAEKKLHGLVNARLEQNMISGLKILMDFLDEHGKYKQLMPFVRKLEQYGKENKNQMLYLRALDNKIKCLRSIGTEEEYQEACIEYFELQTTFREDENIGKSKNASMYVSLKRIEERQRMLEEKRKILKEKSEYDALTNLKNRYAIQAFADGTFKKAAAQGRYVFVDMIDIDYFKQFNDNYGHMSGDRCLLAIGEEIASLIGEKDLGARYGGDEFLIVQLGKTEEEARCLAEELRLRIIERNIPHIYSKSSNVVTISQGCFYAKLEEHETLNDVIQEADLSLMRAKDKAKNRVEMQIRNET